MIIALPTEQWDYIETLTPNQKRPYSHAHVYMREANKRWERRYKIELSSSPHPSGKPPKAGSWGSIEAISKAGFVLTPHIKTFERFEQ